jgi:hypothetical protein
MVRETWTDERLDDLAGRMEKGFDEVKGEIREVKGEVRELRVEMNGLRSEVNTRFDSMNQRFDAMQRTMIIGFVTLFASIVASMIAAAILT